MAKVYQVAANAKVRVFEPDGNSAYKDTAGESKGLIENFKSRSKKTKDDDITSADSALEKDATKHKPGKEFEEELVKDFSSITPAGDKEIFQGKFPD